MKRVLVSTVLTVATAGGLAVAAGSPALAAGQFYPAPGFASPNASCMGSAYDFGAHYGVDGASFPTIVHGGIGPSVSGHATSDGPGAVGAFSSAMAQSHGSIVTCLP